MGLNSFKSWGGGGSVMNPFCGFPSARHQMLPSNYIDSHTKQTVACCPRTTFPIIHCTDNTQLQPIKHTLQALDFLFLIAEYCLAFITVTLQSLS